VNVRIGERTSTLGHISLSSLWVHREQVIGLDPVQGNPTSPHRGVLSHCGVLSVLYSHHIQTLPQYSQMLIKHLTVSEGRLSPQNGGGQKIKSLA